MPDAADDLVDWAGRIARTWPSVKLPDDWAEAYEVEQYVRSRIPLRPAEERPALGTLADLIKPEPPF